MGRHRKYNCPFPEVDTVNMLDNGYFELMDHNHDNEDFYATVSPSENIWKKFELLPTPPLSPEREDCEDQYNIHKLNYDEDWLAAPLYLDRCGTGLQSQVIQDCMWSGGDEQDGKTRTRTISLSELSMVATSTSCVDPTAVHARALNIEHSYSMIGPEPPKMPETPTYTDESESEEEVDVVTVDVSKTAKQPITTTTQFITSLKYGQVGHELSVVAAKLSQNSLKRPKCLSDEMFDAASSKKRKVAYSVQCSRSSSDSEDMCFEGKRSQHNVLERQRRNDLKKSLIKLRSQLPSLRSNDKAPKVVILVHASSYIHELQVEDHKLKAEYKEVRSRQNSLKQRLNFLQSLISP